MLAELQESCTHCNCKTHRCKCTDKQGLFLLSQKSRTGAFGLHWLLCNCAQVLQQSCMQCKTHGVIAQTSKSRFCCPKRAGQGQRDCTGFCAVAELQQSCRHCIRTRLMDSMVSHTRQHCTCRVHAYSAGRCENASMALQGSAQAEADPDDSLEQIVSTFDTPRAYS